MEVFDPSSAERLYNSNGQNKEPVNDGDEFRLFLLSKIKVIIAKYNLNIRSIIDIGCGSIGGFGKLMANKLDISSTELFQYDLIESLENKVSYGNIITGEGLNNDIYDLGLLIQVIRDINSTTKINLAIENIKKRCKYFVITNVDNSISNVDGNKYFGFKWINKKNNYCEIQTKFYNGQVHKYTPFYAYDPETIEKLLLSKSYHILDSGSWVYDDQPIYNYWIVRTMN